MWIASSSASRRTNRRQKFGRCEPMKPIMANWVSLGNLLQGGMHRSPQGAALTWTERRALFPMPLLRKPHHYPGRMVDNSPAFQRRDGGERPSSPEGTVEIDRFSRSFGTYFSGTSNSALKRR